MVDILIVEDESRAAVLLENSLSRLWEKESYRILNVIDTVRGCVDFLQTQNSPDLILMDIQLADGLCFDIFNQVEINGVLYLAEFAAMICLLRGDFFVFTLFCFRHLYVYFWLRSNNANH